MGTWGVGPFDNDEAADWLAALVDVDDATLLHEALDEVAAAGEGEEVEPGWAAVALAAAEVVAAGLGRGGVGLPDEARDWLERHPRVVTDAHLEPARAAVRHVLDASELRDLWLASADGDDWLRRTRDLLERLS
jgi:hypothetical protein